ncbi:hypothetical protein A8B98_15445 [Hymenobacter sp. UV11]|nr:hypothetical protein A8B98_15445 [Hymenobacter sp. UV11]
MRRGLPALLLIATGIGLSVVFRKSSAWPADIQHMVFPVALVLAVGGSNLLSSYVRQRPLAAMKMELLSSLCLVATLLLLR